MSIAIACPTCNRAINAADKFAGKKVRCPDCSTVVPVPAPASQATRRNAAPASVKQKSAGPAPAETWHVRFANGQQIGPVNRAQLDQAVSNGRVDAGCQLWQPGWPQWAQAGEIYPELILAMTVGEALPSPASRSLSPLSPAADPLPTGRPKASRPRPYPGALTQFLSNPIGYMIRGPMMPDYEKSDRQGWKRSRNHRIAWGLLGTWLAMMLLAGLVSTAYVGPAGLFVGVLATFIVTCIPMAIGFYVFLGALFEWGFFFNAREAKRYRMIFGNQGARTFYFLLGGAFLAVGYFLCVYCITKFPSQNKQPVATPSPAATATTQPSPASAGSSR